MRWSRSRGRWACRSIEIDGAMTVGFDEESLKKMSIWGVDMAGA